MSQISDISSHSFSKSDKLFLDTNIWLSIYGPMTFTQKRASTYSKAILDIRKFGCAVFIDILVVSEFINSYARWEYKQSLTKYKTFKDFRKSSSFTGIAKDISNNVKRIINQCKRCGYDFVKEDIEKLLTEFGYGDFDYNDQIFTEICKSNGLILVTDDGDFKGLGLNILTANNRLLNI